MNTSSAKKTDHPPKADGVKYYKGMVLPDEVYIRAYRLVLRGYYRDIQEYLDRWYIFQNSRHL